MLKTFMNAQEAAHYLGRSVKTLANWRCRGKGPAFINDGRICYDRSVLDAWRAQFTARSTAEARQKRGAING